MQLGCLARLRNLDGPIRIRLDGDQEALMSVRGFVSVGKKQGGSDTDKAGQRAEGVNVTKVESGNLPRRGAEQPRSCIWVVSIQFVFLQELRSLRIVVAGGRLWCCYSQALVFHT